MTVIAQYFNLATTSHCISAGRSKRHEHNSFFHQDALWKQFLGLGVRVEGLDFGFVECLRVSAERVRRDNSSLANS